MVLSLFLVSSVLDESVRLYFQNLGVEYSVDAPPKAKEGIQNAQMIDTALDVVTSAIRILKILLCMAIVVATVRFIGYVITTYRKSGSASEISTLLRTVLSVVIYIVGFFIIFSHYFPSVQLAPLFTGSTILGIVVGLALQDTLGNLFAGLALQADQPFQVGDVINITGKGTGVVESVSWRGVKIRTFQNKVLIISNSVIGKEAIEVSPKGNLNARSVFFSTIYEASPARTTQVVRDAVRTAENVSQKMRPVVRIRNLGDNGLEWEIKYWLDDYTKYNDTDALLRERVWYALNREQISFSHPELNVHVQEKPVEVAPEEAFNTIAKRLQQVSIFAPLDDEEIERLANASTSRVYAPDEAIVRLGQQGNSMFVIIRGSVKIQIPERDYIKTINTLRENDFFGEMSLLTGEPRSATVIAMEEAEVLRIDKNGLKPILESNPTLVQSISELVDERRQLLVKISEEAEEEEKLSDAAKKGMIGSIRKFFGLRKGSS
nr:cAMP-binding protein [uncultured bacterium]